MKNSVTELYNAYSIMHFCVCVKNTFKAMLCQMCGNYSKTKSEIMKYYQTDHINFLAFQMIDLEISNPC